MHNDLLFTYFLGAFLGDGNSYKGKRHGAKTRIGCCDKEIITRCYFAVLERYGEEFRGRVEIMPARPCDNLDQYHINWSKVELHKLLMELVGDYKLHLPQYVWTAEQQIKLAMLAGLFDTDGNITQNELKFSGTLPFVAEVPYLLASAGIRIRNILIEREDDTERKPILRVYASLSSAIKNGFYFRCRRKQFRLEGYAKRNELQVNYPVDSLSELETGGDASVY